MTETMKVYDVIVVTQFFNCKNLLMFVDKQMRVYALTNGVLGTSLFVHVHIPVYYTDRNNKVYLVSVYISVLWDTIRFFNGIYHTVCHFLMYLVLY